MSDRSPDVNPVHLTASGPPETRLPGPSAEYRHRLKRALESNDARSDVADVVATEPRESLGWAELGRLAGDPISAYAFYRVGYHRGLDTLRANGWRGSGFVRWNHQGNVGFLRCLDGLRRLADRIGEDDEAERCRLFLAQLDPHGSAPE